MTATEQPLPTNRFRVDTLGYIDLTTPDLAAAIEFYTRVVRLEVTERRDGLAFLSGGSEHHWLRIREGGPAGVNRIGYKVPDDATLDEITAVLDERQIAYKETGDILIDRVEQAITLTDPGGMELELFVEMAQLPVPPLPNGVNLSSFLHAVWSTGDLRASYDFYTEVLGFRPSDWAERFGVFMRCGDRYHHSLALLQGQGPARFDHFCIQVDSLDDVMRARNNATALGVELRSDLLRHAPSGSIGIYVSDPLHGHAVEFCTDHPQVPDEHVARTLPLTPWTLDIWRNPLSTPLIGEPASTTLDRMGAAVAAIDANESPALAAFSDSSN